MLDDDIKYIGCYNNMALHKFTETEILTFVSDEDGQWEGKVFHISIQEVTDVV